MVEELVDWSGNRIVPLYTRHRVLSKHRLYPPTFPLIAYRYESAIAYQNQTPVSVTRLRVYAPEYNSEENNFRWKVISKPNPNFTLLEPEDPVTNPKRIPVELPESVRQDTFNEIVDGYLGPTGIFYIFMQQYWNYIDGRLFYPGAAGVVLTFTNNVWSAAGPISGIAIEELIVGARGTKVFTYSRNSRKILTPWMVSYGDGAGSHGPLAAATNDYSIISPYLSKLDPTGANALENSTYCGSNRVRQEVILGLGIARCRGTDGRLHCTVYVGQPPTYTDYAMNPVDPKKTAIVGTFLFTGKSGSVVTDAELSSASYDKDASTDYYLDGHVWGTLNGPKDVWPLSTATRIRYSGLEGCKEKLIEGLQQLGYLATTYGPTVYDFYKWPYPDVEPVDGSVIYFRATLHYPDVIGPGPHLIETLETTQLAYLYETDCYHPIDDPEGSPWYYSLYRTGFMEKFDDDPATGDYFHCAWDFVGNNKILGRRACYVERLGDDYLSTHLAAVVESSSGGSTWDLADSLNYPGLDFYPKISLGDDFTREIHCGGVNPYTQKQHLVENINAFIGFIVPGCYLVRSYISATPSIPKSITVSVRDPLRIVMPISQNNVGVPAIQTLISLTLVWPPEIEEPPEWEWSGVHTMVDIIEIKLEDTNPIPDSAGVLPSVIVTYNPAAITNTIQANRLWAATPEEKLLGPYYNIEDQQILGIAFGSVSLLILPKELEADYSTTIMVEIPPDNRVLSFVDLPPKDYGVVYYNRTYVFYIGVYGGTGPYTWSLVDGALPLGWTLEAATGILSGMTTSSGGSPTVPYDFTVGVTDSATPPAVISGAFSLTTAEL